MKHLILVTLLLIGSNAFCATKEEHFTGDQAKGLLRQLKQTGARTIGSSYVANNVNCDEATVQLVQISNPTAPSVPYKTIGCSADPKVGASGLEAFVMEASYRGLAFTGWVIINVSKRNFVAAELSCVDNSDRCSMTLP